MYKWTWPSEGPPKLKKPLHFQLNSFLSIRVVGKYDVQLQFKSNEEVVKLNVGQVPPEVAEAEIYVDPTVRVFNISNHKLSAFTNNLFSCKLIYTI